MKLILVLSACCCCFSSSIARTADERMKTMLSARCIGTALNVLDVKSQFTVGTKKFNDAILDQIRKVGDKKVVLSWLCERSDKFDVLLRMRYLDHKLELQWMSYDQDQTDYFAIQIDFDKGDIPVKLVSSVKVSGD